MAATFALLCALAYGTSDFIAGVASRRSTATVVTAGAQMVGLATAVVAVFLFPGVGPRWGALEWGALSGLGNAAGTLALYQGFAVARMTTVATVSAVLSAAVPVLVGVFLGNRLGVLAWVGIAVALPAIVMVSWRSDGSSQSSNWKGAVYGTTAGLAFALLFVSLDRAGTRSGAWPIVAGEFVSVLPILPLAIWSTRATGAPSGAVVRLILAAGVLAGTANLLFLAATGHGALAIVAVLAALYPAVTVVLARAFLAEYWTRLQAVGLAVAVVAIVLVTT